VEDKKLTFLASIAPLQSAIKIAHDGGGRVAFDIPESEMPAIMRLVLYRGRTVRITIEETRVEKKPKAGLGKWQKD
jgi:hypothetical protein